MKVIAATLSLLLAVTSAFAQDSPTTASSQNPEQRCRNGEAAACYDYGTTLYRRCFFDRVGLQQAEPRPVNQIGPCKSNESPESCTDRLTTERSDLIYQAVWALRRGCNLGNAESCTATGMHYYGRRDFAEASQHFEKGCRLQQGAACTVLAEMYENGTGLRLSYQKAAQFYEAACQLKNGLACYKLAKLHQVHGRVLDSDSAMREFFGLACDYGIREGCEDFAKLAK